MIIENLKDKYYELKEFGIRNKCDSCLLNDGTIKEYCGERWNVLAIYKVQQGKVYKL